MGATNSQRISAAGWSPPLPHHHFAVQAFVCFGRATALVGLGVQRSQLADELEVAEIVTQPEHH
jgi:hypothetical protein